MMVAKYGKRKLQMPVYNEMTIEEYEREAKRLKRERWEIEFAKQLDAEGNYRYWREYQFHPTRKWRFDFIICRLEVQSIYDSKISTSQAIKDGKLIAVEIEGGIYSQGRHTRGSGFMKDCEKYNTAAARGWKVFRFPSSMVEDGSAIKFLKEEVFHS